MAMLRRLAALGAAAEAARRYARQNPEKVRDLTDKAAAFADKQTKGKYTAKINSAKHKVGEVAGMKQHNPPPYPGQDRPTPFKRD